MLRLKIAHYIPAVRLSDGGVVRAVLDSCRLLGLRGHQTTLLTYDASDVPAEWNSKQDGFPNVLTLARPHRLGRLSRSALASAQTAIAAADVLHLHGMWLPSSLQLGALARRVRTPYVISLHGMLDDWATDQKRLKKRLFHGLFGRRFIERAARIHCTADEERRQALPWLGAAPVTVLPCIVDLEPFRKLTPRITPRDESPPAVLFLGRLHPKKGLEVLIDAVAELRRRNCPVSLSIAGEGEPSYEADLKARVNQLGLDEVNFLGLVVGPGKLELLRSADLFVLPTRQENFGLALIEAAACGTPLLTTQGVDIWRELALAGAAIADRSATAFADTIEQLMRDRQTLEKKGEALREWVFHTLDPEVLLPEYERFYEVAHATASPLHGVPRKGA